MPSLENAKLRSQAKVLGIAMDGHAIATWKGEEIYLWDAVTGERKVTFTNGGKC